MTVKHNPPGNRIFKDSSQTGQRKYIVDIVGDLPVILLELDPNDDMNIEKTYIYGNSQILAQHEGDYGATRYFYLHDRLGSVRQVIDTMGNVVNHYTYRPFGELYPGPDFEETVTNPFKFTGQFYDFEINEYYLRARMYDPHIGRFTARDPVRGKFEEPLTLHAYLYCIDNPVNGMDPAGLWTFYVTGTAMASYGVSSVGQIGIVIDDDGNVGFISISGIGAGSPAATLGVSFGVTSADTIFGLQGAGGQIGGTFGPVGVPGLEFLVGGSAANTYLGAEATLGATLTPVPPPWSAEIHGHYTETTVIPTSLNWRESKDMMKNYLMEAMFSSRTVGEAYALSFVWGILPD